MALKRRTKKLSKSQVLQVTGRHYVICSECSKEELEVSIDIGSVVCARCVQKMIAPPAGYINKEKSDKPRGWHFKQYFEHNGVVYSKGVEVSDVDEIKRLKKNAKRTTVVTKKSTHVEKKSKVPRGKRNARTPK